ncbi:AAA family ATPase [Paenibacillus alkalitolerans]|uniref:AAA family ATPase n=1 Tax=Paenibacillus alkalitolerans TaxID=2799335 RepID=UPI0018F3FC77|nr:hypothetical protein [Paenibacillus alkalitolerans]
MSALLGMKQGDLLTAVQSSMAVDGSLTVVHEKAAFFSELDRSYDEIVLHSSLFQESYPWEWVATVRNRQPQAKITVIPDETVYDSLWLEILYRLADEAGIRIAPLGISDEEIIRVVNDSDNDPTTAGPGIVTAIWSAASKDGATAVAINTALALARHSPLQIGLLDLNLKNPEIRACLHLPERDRSNLTLRSKLQTGVLKRSELWDTCIPYRQSPQLRILPGTHRRDTADDVTPDMVKHLLDVCRTTFDITIVDVSAIPDNAATICAVRHADVRWLVAQQRFGSYLWSWNEWYDCYWKYVGLDPGRMSFILNGYDPQGEKPEKIAGSLRMDVAGVLPNVAGGAGVKAVQEGIPLCDMPGAESFASGVHRLASVLSVAAGASPLPEQNKGRRNGVFSILSALFS